MRHKMLWAAVALMMTACSSDNDESIVNPENNERTPISLTRPEQELVTSNNDFAFNLFRMAGPRKIWVEDPEKGIILSPISITYALGMLNNGAAGEKLTKVQIANNIYVNKDYTLNPVFVEKANDYYNAQPETRDFADGKTLDVINQWASDHTEKMIEEVLHEKEFKPDAVSYLLNAIYFKGTWAEKFKKAETKEEVFEHAGPNKNLIYVPMMHQQTTLRRV